MRGGDRGDYGQPEPYSVVTASALSAEPLEGLQQAADLIGGNPRAGVDYSQARLARGDVHTAGRDVVSDRVLQQVRHQALDELCVAEDAAGGKDGTDPHLTRGGLRGAGPRGAGGYRRDRKSVV